MARFASAACRQAITSSAAVSRMQGTRDGGEWQNPDLLLQLEARAERITLSEGQSRTVTLRLIER